MQPCSERHRRSLDIQLRVIFCSTFLSEERIVFSVDCIRSYAKSWKRAPEVWILIRGHPLNYCWSKLFQYFLIAAWISGLLSFYDRIILRLWGRWYNTIDLFIEKKFQTARTISNGWSSWNYMNTCIFNISYLSRWDPPFISENASHIQIIEYTKFSRNTWIFKHEMSAAFSRRSCLLIFAPIFYQKYFSSTQPFSTKRSALLQNSREFLVFKITQL